MAGTSFLDAATVAEIAQVRHDGLATSIALGGVSLVLYRFNAGTGQYDARPAQTVVVRWAARQPEAGATPAATTTLVAGELRGFALDVQIGDSFVLGGARGTIVAPVTTEHGITKAAFAVDQGNA
jgi:hypothetical protein